MDFIWGPPCIYKNAKGKSKATNFIFSHLLIQQYNCSYWSWKKWEIVEVITELNKL